MRTVILVQRLIRNVRFRGCDRCWRYRLATCHHIYSEFFSDAFAISRRCDSYYGLARNPRSQRQRPPIGDRYRDEAFGTYAGSVSDSVRMREVCRKVNRLRAIILVQRLIGNVGRLRWRDRLGRRIRRICRNRDCDGFCDSLARIEDINAGYTLRYCGNHPHILFSGISSSRRPPNR